MNPKTDGLRLTTNAAYPKDSKVTVTFNSVITTLQSLGLISYTQSASPPAGPSLHALWYKPDTGLAANTTPAGDSNFYKWDGSAWQPMTPSRFAAYIISLAGSFLPSDLAGYLYNDGSGNLSWTTPPGGGGGGGPADGDYGDISIGGGGTSYQIDTNVVSNAKLADMPVNTFKMRKTAGTGDPEDINPKDLTNEAAPAGTRIVMTFDPVSGEAKKSPISSLPTVAVGKGLVAMLRVTGSTITPIFGCSLATPSGPGSRFALSSPLSGACRPVAMTSSYTSAHDGDGAASGSIDVSNGTATHFNVQVAGSSAPAMPNGWVLVFAD